MAIEDGRGRDHAQGHATVGGTGDVARNPLLSTTNHANSDPTGPQECAACRKRRFSNSLGLQILRVRQSEVAFWADEVERPLISAVNRLHTAVKQIFDRSLVQDFPTTFSGILGESHLFHANAPHWNDSLGNCSQARASCIWYYRRRPQTPYRSEPTSHSLG